MRADEVSLGLHEPVSSVETLKVCELDIYLTFEKV